jgi:positive phototaxis protein PixI
LNLVNDRQANRSSLIESDLPIQQQVLGFLLDPSLTTSLAEPLRWSIEIDRITELVNIPIDRVVPMPHLSSAVMGVYNWRGEILWIIDLAMLLGAVGASRRYLRLQPTMIISGAASQEVGRAAALEPQQSKTIGLVVDEIAEIEWCDLEPISAPILDRIQPGLSRWVRGLWVSATGKNLLGLDEQAIFECADLHADL